ncbi:MAG: DUF4827 domain-containing protein [Tannerella sp.]|nr:DUF4827 domain-containing protein [Tannerella sp.]
MTVFFFSACNKNKTYADMKRDQKKAIDRLITEKGFEIIYDYPKNKVFKANQFVLLENGVYLNVVDSGNGNRAKPYSTTFGGTRILMRCSGEYLFIRGDTTFNTFAELVPIEFTYGQASSTMSKYAYLYTSGGIPHPVCMFLSTGVESALEHVGENAEVKLIVPFEIGSTYQTNNNYGAPLYYDKIKFQFY